MASKGYNVEIVESSRQNMTARERLMLKDTSGAKSLNDLVKDDEGLVITPIDYAVLNIHNDNAKDGQNKDFTNYLILDNNGERYITGSESFWESFKDIWDEMMADGTGEAFDIKVYTLPSKNYNGSFITCSIM